VAARPELVRIETDQRNRNERQPGTLSRWEYTEVDAPESRWKSPAALKSSRRLPADSRSKDMFFGNSIELEYGTRAWWTSEFYLDTQSTIGESTVFAGFRLENRFRPLMAEHMVNPMLYVEVEDINAANKSLLEVVGHDSAVDFLENNRAIRGQKNREGELKLILSSDAKGWNFAEKVIAEKNLSNAPREFGYALAASRPSRLTASSGECRHCAENFQLGVEMYGGLGTATASASEHLAVPCALGEVGFAVWSDFHVLSGFWTQ
jgi:hypothetical protein